MSRSLTDLDSAFRAKVILFQAKCVERRKFDVLIYCTFRSMEEQARLYRQGRSYLHITKTADKLQYYFNRPDLAHILIDVGPQHGKFILTNAAPGMSLHNYGLAFDGVPLLDGKLVWETSSVEQKALWNQYGELIESCQMEWSGRWSRFREYPHGQEIGVDWRELIK